MARTTHVKKAQQRYKTMPVIDPATGEQKKTPVMRNGEQRKTKKGKLVFLSITEADKTQPLPPETCTACHKPIEVGTAYKWIQPKSGPYGGRRMARHESCPGWQVWDYSNSLSAQLSRISYDFNEAIDTADGADDVQSALDSAAESIKEIAEQKREGASNIEEGFGHPTSQSEELEQMADDLEQWADDVSSADIPEMTQCEECSGEGKVDCDTCTGTGKVEDDDEPDGKATCADCESGQVDCETCDGDGDDIEAWRDEVRDNVTIVDESPV